MTNIMDSLNGLSQNVKTYWVERFYTTQDVRGLYQEMSTCIRNANIIDKEYSNNTSIFKDQVIDALAKGNMALPTARAVLNYHSKDDSIFDLSEIYTSLKNHMYLAVGVCAVLALFMSALIVLLLIYFR